MRRLLLSGTAALALSAGTAFAGGLAEPIMAPEVVAAQTGSSAAGIVVPILLLLLIAAAASAKSGGGGGGAAAGAGGVAQASDRRLKTDVTWMGMKGNLAVYRWRYLDRPGTYEGVMAQEVLRSRPGSVVPRGDGLLMVDYTHLPVPFRRIN